jgi:hypothetical protein
MKPEPHGVGRKRSARQPRARVNSEWHRLAAHSTPRMRPVIDRACAQHVGTARREGAPNCPLYRTAVFCWRQRPVTQIRMMFPFHSGALPHCSSSSSGMRSARCTCCACSSVCRGRDQALVARLELRRSGLAVDARFGPWFAPEIVVSPMLIGDLDDPPHGYSLPPQVALPKAKACWPRKLSQHACKLVGD